MRERERRLESLVPLATLGLLVIASFGAFTKKQRDAIAHDRDDGECQFPDHHECKGGLHVHHIIPQRYAKEVGIEDPDFAENGITLCENSHVGPDGIHPDIASAKRQYGGNRNSFSEVFEERQRKIENREIYWNSQWDRQLLATAVRNTQRAKARGWSFPIKRKQG